ncbi:MAG: cadherin-like domain-containing protein, partial [Rubrivivax sp.]|nr:cadherin-like domain-containing protein [Rubrivivax sp.]
MIGSQRALTLGLFIVAAPLAAAPVLLDDAYTPTSAVFVVPAPGVLANDSSASGGLRVLSLDITGLQGTVTAFPNGRFSFTPAPGLATDTSFRYTATDNGGGLAAATVRFDMVSTLPLALPDNYTPNGATFVVPAAQGLLANDSGGIGSLQVLSLDITGTQGTVTAFADGRFSFTPAPGLATDTSFAYTLVDSAG